MSPMAVKKLNFLEEVGKLKRSERRGWIIKGIDKPETISGHMYRMSLMALLVLDKFDDMDKNKIIKLCLIHDLAECIVGDITPHDNVSKEDKHKLETEAINHLASLLPNHQATELKELFDEYENQESSESRITKDFDIFDMVQQAFEYEKLEFVRTGVIPDLSEFFSQSNVLSRINNKEVNDLVKEIIKQREDFWKIHSKLPRESLIENDQSKEMKSTTQAGDNKDNTDA